MGGIADLIRRGTGLSGPANLGDLSSWAARRFGARIAFEMPADRSDLSRPDRLSYEEFESLVSGLASRLSPQVESGDSVLVRGESGVMFLACVLAVGRAGGVAVPVNPELTAAELEYVVEDSGAAAEIAPGHLSVLDAIERVEAEWGADGERTEAGSGCADDVAAVFYTSGTTGHPKGAMLSHRGLLTDLGLARVYPSGIRADLLVEALPTAHIMGFLILAGALAAGIRTFAFERFRPVAVLDAIESFRASLFVGVPAMYRMMLDSGARHRDLKSVRIWMSAADAMPKELAREFQKMGASFALGGRPLGEALFVEAYGMVEYSGAATVKVSLPFWNPFPEAIGVPLPGTRLRIVDDDGNEVAHGEVGEIEIHGAKMLSGYRNRPEETGAAVQSGWLRTGDLGRRGRVIDRFAGRSKDVVTSGGYTVYAVEIEEQLRNCEGVSDAAVVGIADAVLGEIVAAAVEPAPGAAIDEKKLKLCMGEKVAEYKLPVRYLIVDRLPRGATRKVQKERVRSMFEAALDG